MKGNLGRRWSRLWNANSFSPQLCRERKRAEEKLAASEAELRALFAV